MSLLEPKDPDDHAGRLNYACQLGHTAFVEAVVRETGIKDMNARDQYGSTPLYNAAMKNDNPRLIEYLIDKGANVDLRTEDDETPLYIAAYNNHTECMKVLLKRGAQVNAACGYYGDTPLHITVRHHFPAAFDVLCEAGADVNARNKHKETPLFLACKLNKRDMVYKLLMSKAKQSLADRDGKDCQYVASEKKHADCLRLLKAAGPAELLQIKKGWEAAEAAKSKKQSDKRPSWDEVAFQKELIQFGVTEEEAKRKERPFKKLPDKKDRPRRVRDPSKPQPLFDSDEDSDELEERLAKQSAEQAEKERLLEEFRRKAKAGFSDPSALGGGTGFNPTGCHHVRHATEQQQQQQADRHRKAHEACEAAVQLRRAAEAPPAAAVRSSSRGRKEEPAAPAGRAGSKPKSGAPADEAPAARSGSRTRQPPTAGKKPAGKLAGRR